MFRKRLTVYSILGTLMLVLMLGVVPVSAAGPSGTYVSGIACVNLSNSSGQYVVSFYNTSGGAAVATLTGSVGAKGNFAYFTPNISTLPSGFLGSAVVSADQPVGCSVNTQTAAGASPTRIGTASGVSSSDTGNSLYVPQVLNSLGGFSSFIAVQNAGNAATTATLRVFNSAGTQVYTTNRSVPANSSSVFYQDDGALPSGFIGSATVTSNGQPLAGIVNFYNAGTSTSNAQYHSYNAFRSGSNKVFGPRVAKNLSGVGYTSGISCQNVGGSATTITANFTVNNQVGGGTATGAVSSGSIAPSQSWAIYLGNNIGSATLDGIARYFGSVIITASGGGQIVCIFNEDNRTNFAGQGSSYNGIPDGQQSLNMFFPQVVNLGAGSFQGGFQIQNTTNQAGTCNYHYSNGTNVNNVALPASGSNSVFAAAHVSNFNGSVSVDCTRAIVGIANLSVFGGAGGDPFATSNGINE